MIVGIPLVLLLAQAATTTAPAAPAAAQSLSKATAQTQVKANFDRLDTNKDGWVDRAEAQNVMGAAATKRRTDLIAAAFTKADTNKDGQISRQEFEVMTPPAKVDAGPWVVANDTDKNGRVSLQEANARVMADFDRMDTDHNGVVTSQEAAATRRPR